MMQGHHGNNQNNMHLHMSAPPATNMNQMSTGGSSTGSNAHRKLFPNSDNGQV
jgi:hypothetical protein